MTKTFIIAGDPKGKARPRITRHGAYTPKSTVVYEDSVRVAYLDSCEDGAESFAEGVPLAVTIEAYYGIPKSSTKYMKMLMRRNEVRPTKKPDWDNIGKIICDALNGVAYKDDAQVVKGQVTKYYTEDDPFVVVEITDEI